MSEFDHLRKLDITNEATAEYALTRISVNGKSPKLILAPATEANKRYHAAVLKRAPKAAKMMKDGAFNIDTLDEYRQEDRDLFAKHVIKGWIDMLSLEGNEINFSEAACQDFLKALPDWIFDDIREFAGNATNFSDVMDVDTLAGNLSTATSGSSNIKSTGTK